MEKKLEYKDLPEYKKNELEVVDLLNEIDGIEAYSHPLKYSGYDVGALVDSLCLNKDYPLWASSYLDPKSSKTVFAVEVKNRTKHYAYFYMEVDKVKTIKRQVMKDRASNGAVPLYCCSYVDNNGDKVHLVYDVRWIETHKPSLEKMNDQTVFNGKKKYTGESRQGNKKEKMVHRFRSDMYLFKMQKGKPAEYGYYIEHRNNT